MQIFKYNLSGEWIKTENEHESTEYEFIFVKQRKAVLLLVWN